MTNSSLDIPSARAYDDLALSIEDVEHFGDRMRMHDAEPLVVVTGMCDVSEFRVMPLSAVAYFVSGNAHKSPIFSNNPDQMAINIKN